MTTDASSLRLRSSSPTHAGGIVFRWDGSRRRYLLVRAKQPPDAWVFPKGHIERGETPEKAAKREVLEEAGIHARVVAPLGRLPVGAGNEAAMFLMSEQREENPQVAERETLWLDLDTALDTLTFSESRKLLRVAATMKANT